MSERASTEPQLFRCPTCGASLPVPDAPSVKCQYCGSNVLVPPEYRPAKQPEPGAYTPQVVIQVPAQSTEEWSGKGRRSLGGILAVIMILVVVCVVTTWVLSMAGVFSTTALISKSINTISTQAPGNLAIATPIKPAATALPTKAPVDVALKFGGEGSGAGQFDDPRYIALDPDNNIFIADYSDGRIQKFDPSGKFLQLINVEPDRNQNTIIRDMATDFSGSLFIVRGGDILVYNSADGKLINTIPGKFPNLSYDMLAIDAANNLYAISEGAGFADLIKMDAEGKQLWKKSNFLEGVVKRNTPANVNRIAVDGLGNIFVLNGFSNEIYKFDTQGNFVDRFGSKGKELQQLNSPDAMAINEDGNIFVVDSGNWYTIKVFDGGGTFLGALAWPEEVTFPREIIFDLQGNLFTVTNTAQVARMSLDLGKLGN
jgi:DNA-binding beta-propeller fold protein YncE/DNA-directed RNA polymerase subunit RPC12/RpoP